MIREITNNKDLLRKEICKFNIEDFSELENSIFRNSEYNRDTVVEILGKLKEIAKVHKRYLTMKSENISYYNEAWGICRVFPDIFLDRFLSFEKDLINAYSELFFVVNGNRNAKIVLPEKKALYVCTVLEKLEDMVSIDFKGRVYSELSKARNMKFEEFRLTDEFDEVTKKYEDDRKKRLALIDNMIEVIDEYQYYAIFNKEEVYELTYINIEAKVDNIA